MRDDDPRSLNDDFVRTFTVSSPPGHPPNPVRRLKDDEFEITVRRVGAVTEELFKHQGSEGGDRMELEVGVKGFGGEFEARQEGDENVAFVAAGVGITPLLPCVGVLDLGRLRVLWTVRKEDLGLVEDVVDGYPGLADCLTLFVTNAADGEAVNLKSSKVDEIEVQKRRLRKDDLDLDGQVQKYYLCTGTPLRKQLMEWLPDKDLIFEDFNF